MLAVLEFAAIVATALFGILGSLVDFRDRQGGISSKGWTALVGIVVSSSIGGVLQIYSNHLDEERTIALMQNTASILNGLSRSLNPLHVVTADISLTADWSAGALKEYFDLFEQDLRGTVPGDVRTSGMSSLPHPVCELNVTSDSCEKELVVYDIFCAVQVVLFFYKNPIDPDASFSDSAETHGEDLRVSFENPCVLTKALAKAGRRMKGEKVGPPPLHRVGLGYDSWHGRLTKLDFQIRYDDDEDIARKFQGNSKIMSLHDLLGAQLVIRVASPRSFDEEIDRLRKTVILRHLVLKLQSGVMLTFSQQNLRSHKPKHGYQLYSMIFPDTLENLLAFTAYN